MLEAPITYRVHFHLPIFHSKDDVEIQSFSRSFEVEDPFVNRENAFEFFYNCIEGLKDNNRVKLNEETNEYEFIDVKLGPFISITLVLSDEALATINNAKEELFHAEKENVVYGIGNVGILSQSVNPDDMFDFVIREYHIYQDLNIDTSHSEMTIEYYGEDYVSSGYVDSVNQILKVNYKWDSENYNKEDAQIEKENAWKRKVELADNRAYFNELTENGEGRQLEFKPFLVFNPKTGKPGITAKYHCAKTLASFLNTKGGVLIIGLSDDKQVHGIEEFDIKLCCGGKLDNFKLEFDSMVTQFLPKWVLGVINTVTLEVSEGTHVFMAVVEEANTPIYLENRRYGEIDMEFFIRGQASSQKLNEVEIEEYLLNHYDKE